MIQDLFILLGTDNETANGAVVLFVLFLSHLCHLADKLSNSSTIAGQSLESSYTTENCYVTDAYAVE
jgi:hypothetical protein